MAAHRIRGPATVVACLLALPALAPPAHSAFPGRNGRIAYQQVTGLDSRIATVDPRTGAGRLLPLGTGAFHPAWSPGGTRLAFGGGRDAAIIVARADGSHPRQITHPGQPDSADDGPTWAADGRLLAFQSNRSALSGPGDVWLVGLGGRLLRPLLTGPRAEIEPAFAPRGRHLAFASDRQGMPDLYSIRVDGGDFTRLTRTRAVEGEPAWSPDGRRIAFAGDRSGHGDIYVMSSNGRRVRRLTRSPLVDQSPAWSPDGRLIAFARGPDLARNPEARGTFDIWLMDARGRHQRPIVTTPRDDLAPDWQPLPRR
jgi:TolB protein